MKCLKASIRYASDITDFSIRNGSAEITCEFEVGAPKKLPFYHDEISISAEECVGKTWDEIVALKRKRDIAFLQS